MIHHLDGYAHPPRTRAVLRGVAAVAASVLSASDAMLSALAGVPPFAWCAKQAASTVRAVYRAGRYGKPSESTAVELHVVDAEIIDDERSAR